jgi:hypothetical protein
LGGAFGKLGAEKTSAEDENEDEIDNFRSRRRRNFIDVEPQEPKGEAKENSGEKNEILYDGVTFRDGRDLKTNENLFNSGNQNINNNMLNLGAEDGDFSGFFNQRRRRSSGNHSVNSARRGSENHSASGKEHSGLKTFTMRTN